MDEDSAPGQSDPAGPSSEAPEQPLVQHDREAMPVDTEEAPHLPFPVVGIGASAGGLEALSQFIAVMPPDAGLAYVVVQHLPPDRESMMADILSKRTTMPVAQIEDGMKVEPDHVYLIRPGHTLTIEHGVLKLGERVVKPMHSRPIDDFFKSLASDQRERAIAIIMSGMGSNGAAGAQAIKAVGGLCIAQDPDSAQFPSMPRHLIDAGYADYILPPHDIPSVLLGYAQHPYAQGAREDRDALVKREEQQMREILAILRTRTRQDFNGYKKPTVFRRIQRRMGLNRITALGDYAKFLRQSPSEVSSLVDDLLIHVTGFFRDPEAWEILRERVVVPLVAARESHASVRAWVAACSSGEEAYTLAMLLVEESERVGKSLDIKVFATDMAERTLANARQGIYPGGIESDVIPQRLEHFFQREDSVYRVRQELRECVVFAPQNVLQDPPFSRLDIVTCRNLLIYLEPEIQQRVLSLVHFGLREGGALFLGTSETTGDDDLFEPVDKKARIFRRVGPTRHGSIHFPSPISPITTLGPDGEPIKLAESRLNLQRNVALTSIQQLTLRALLENHTPAAVTIDRDFRIHYFHGDTEPFLTPPRGEPTRDLMTLVRDNVRGAVRQAVQAAMQKNAPATFLDGWIERTPGRHSRVSVTASPLDPRKNSDYFVVSFFDRGELPHPGPVEAGEGYGNDARDELVRVRHELQSTIEELQTSNEELKASHEELVSTNEELQSTNEELETSREEMQSLNEELSTVNSQLHAKMEEHQAASNDLTSLLTSTDIAVLFLDTRFRIRRYTPAVSELLDLISTDIGRPLADLARKFTDPRLDEDSRTVLERLVPSERNVSAANGRQYVRRVLPYRTTDNRIDGVVITFMDVTRLKSVEEALRESEERFRALTERWALAVWEADASGVMTTDSPSWRAYTGQTLQAWLGEGWAQVVHPEDREYALSQWRESVKTGTSLDAVYRLRSSGGEWRWTNVRAVPLRDGDGGIRKWVGMNLDITDRKIVEEALRESEERFRTLFENIGDYAIILLDPRGIITMWNAGAEQILGFTEGEALGQSGEIIFTPEDRAAAAPQQELTQARATGRAMDERWHIRKDRSRFWGSGMTSVLHHADGALRGYVKIMRDETARKQAEEALSTSKQSAEEANRVKDDFLATLSHELRTPLGAILLWVKLLEGGSLSEPAQLQEAVNAIRTSAEAQRELIEDLLDVSRISSGNLRLRARDLDVGPLIHDAVEAIGPAVEAKQLIVSTELAPDLGRLRVDPTRLRQIVWNLLTNAVKFTPAGGRIDVTLRRHDRNVEIRVADTGHGITPDLLPHIFERFRQGDASHVRTHGGVGLGLAIVKQLVELHGGTITAQSAGVGKGATFTVRLPLSRINDGDARSAPQSATGTKDPLVDLSTRSVLLVEDDGETRHALATLLAQEGMRVIDVDSALAALQAFSAQRPDLIISDIGLPTIDGYQFMRQLRTMESVTHPSKSKPMTPVPAIALTAYAYDSDRNQAIDAGFQRYLGKPFEPTQLIVIVRDLLSQPVSPAR